MKLFKYICGDYEKLGVANDDADAYNRREEVDPTFHYLPVTIEEVKVDGYEITVRPEVEHGQAGNKRNSRGKETPNG